MRHPSGPSACGGDAHSNKWSVGTAMPLQQSAAQQHTTAQQASHGGPLLPEGYLSASDSIAHTLARACSEHEETPHRSSHAKGWHGICASAAQQAPPIGPNETGHDCRNDNPGRTIRTVITWAVVFGVACLMSLAMVVQAGVLPQAGTATKPELPAATANSTTIPDIGYEMFADDPYPAAPERVSGCIPIK